MNSAKFKFLCPQCDQPLSSEPRNAGREVKCPSCDQLIQVPNPPSASGSTRTGPASARPWDTRAWGG